LSGYCERRMTVQRASMDSLCMVSTAQKASSASFGDVVSGKGQGLNVLLQYVLHTLSHLNVPDTYKSGPPGVGKTLTAEGVSEHLRRPLYSVSLLIHGLTHSGLMSSQIDLRLGHSGRSSGEGAPRPIMACQNASCESEIDQSITNCC
jgi:hypothetical protein